MITKDEILCKSSEFGIHVAHVQRDYVYGWLLAGIYSATELRDILIFKGGNCFRKAYFPNTRFSEDLDFSTETSIDCELLMKEFNRACNYVQEKAGVTFDVARNNIRVQGQLDEQRRVFDMRLYFRDFYGNAEHIVIRISIDITENDKIYLPPQRRHVIHPYSDSHNCTATVLCHKIEEMIANKLKCLLQRRHVPDVYDLVYSIFINQDIEVNRTSVIRVFLQKTIYEPSPGVARQLLLDLPLAILKNAWNRYIVAPVLGLIHFDDVALRFQGIVNTLFSEYPVSTRASFAYFPSALRRPIMEAGADKRILKLKYDGIIRYVEPYSLVYKRRKDGHREEYFYAWDRTGGRSGPGIKVFRNDKISDIIITDDKFEPRYPIELGKAGEPLGSGYFGGNLAIPQYRKTLRHGWRYTIQCPLCYRSFKRMRRNTDLNAHEDGHHNKCYGRRGVVVSQEIV